MKYKRSERLVYMTQHLTTNPNKLIPLTTYVDKFSQAKSSISEDIRIIKDVLSAEGLGVLQTTAGANGGAIFIPKISVERAKKIIADFKIELEANERLLPGGYLYMSDIMGDPNMMNDIGDLIATMYGHVEVDAVVTVATKGISLANAVARKLNVPVAVIRKDNKVTEGSTVSINYVSGSTRKIETMVLSKRTLKEGSRVLVVDDFLRAGGSITGVTNLMEEFNATVVGVSVLVEAKEVANRRFNDYKSLLKVSEIDEFNESFVVEEGNCLDYITGK
ncbi:Pur operon repressor [Jeotgalicoccus aerolatus]|uniref:Purine operon repressor n=1 Tax=Jeotgalicoccus aerolatus TaxID=709510 RepID=A0A1G9B641_9STAP|nr:pur operon repressor [Jeotgalicoccus aerolatus]MBP1951985.1 purine operon repressor [Jeotgalicoccus aerolatus]NMA81510.1 pur operon repressor [Jeotgalicoccus aerolatus]CAD2071370.1 Pur operon repressor [Jeotgalicoccus aerolatus]SDK34958.1 purine operon repressor, PurR [Jeotgalicoccus aerolatus]GGE04959.1 pur operon repressor [Jeotgalicoccus aerolatus]